MTRLGDAKQKKTKKVDNHQKEEKKFFFDFIMTTTTTHTVCVCVYKQTVTKKKKELTSQSACHTHKGVVVVDWLIDMYQFCASGLYVVVVVGQQ